MAISESEHKGNTLGIHRGATIPYITNDDVENKVVIELPPIKKQKTIVEQKLREEIVLIKEKASKDKLQLENIVVDAFKEIDHKIRNDLKNIKNATNKIQNFFKANTDL